MITIADVERALADPRHNGFGLAACKRDVTERQWRKLRRVVANRASVLGLEYEAFFAWSDSKYGRWMGDKVSGDVNLECLVEQYLNETALRHLAREGEAALAEWR